MLDNDNTDPTPNPDDIPTTDRFIYDDIDPYPTELNDRDPLFPKTIERERDRDRAIELCNKGYDLYKENKYDEAKKAYLESLKYDDSYARSYNNLGVLYDDQLNDETAIKYFYKAIECDPLFKLAVDNLVRNLQNPKDIAKVLRNYHEALQNHINDNTKVRKELSTKVTKIESRLDDTKLEDYVKETENTLTHIKESESKIDSIEVSLNKRNEELNVTFTNLENHALAEYYQKKANDLREDLDFCWKKMFKVQKKVQEHKEELDGFLGKLFKKIVYSFLVYPSLGFIQKYWGMILIDIAVLLGLSIISSLNFGAKFWEVLKQSPINYLALLEALLTTTPANVWESLGQHAVRISPIMILLLWGTRYFNRRIHETVHLIEEYEHKAIVLKSFPSYSAQLGLLDTPEKTALLKYTEKVSPIITESPTHALTRKKTDKLPMEFVQALNQAHSKN